MTTRSCLQLPQEGRNKVGLQAWVAISLCLPLFEEEAASADMSLGADSLTGWWLASGLPGEPEPSLQAGLDIMLTQGSGVTSAWHGGTRGGQAGRRSGVGLGLQAGWMD
ncbi:unnamed protein product [Lota lota]